MQLSQAKLTRIARRIAEDLMENGDAPKLCNRIQFMGGDYPNETPQGGLNRTGLALEIEKSLKRHLPPETCNL